MSTFVVVVWIAGAANHAAESRATDPPSLPFANLTENHRAFLVRRARRTARDAVLNRSPYEPGYVPSKLRGITTEAVLRLRQHGYLLGVGASGPALLARATRNAALVAAGGLNQDRETASALAQHLLIEIELPGLMEPIAVGDDRRRHDVANQFTEPEIHGLANQGPNGARPVCPPVILAADLALAHALKLLAQEVTFPLSRSDSMSLLQFRTLHWHEPHEGVSMVLVRRGMTLVAPAAVCRERLDDAIARLAEYNAYRQSPSDLFSYQFDPGVNQYSEQDNLVRQVGALVAISAYARISGKSASLAAAGRATRYHLQGLTDIASPDRASFIATLDRHDNLGATALLFIAMSHHPSFQPYDPNRRRLTKGMLSLQRPSCMFVMALPLAEEPSGQDYDPGEALLALAMEYDRQPSALILEASDRAIAFYHDCFRNHCSSRSVHCRVQAFALIARHTGRRDYVDYVFELTDWLSEKQLTSANGEWPEMCGGIAARTSGRAGVSTVSYLEDLAEAPRRVRSVGATARARRNEAPVRAAARFVMQLQVRPKESYFIRSPVDAIGAIRTALAVNRLRIDHCQHALLGLMKKRRALYPDES